MKVLKNSKKKINNHRTRANKYGKIYLKKMDYDAIKQSESLTDKNRKKGSEKVVSINRV